MASIEVTLQHSENLNNDERIWVLCFGEVAEMIRYADLEKLRPLGILSEWLAFVK